MNCPPWNDEWDQKIPADKKQSQIKMAYRCAFEQAKSKVIEVSDVKSWHKTMFGGFVPLSYYAGNFRQQDSSRPCLGVDVAVGLNRGEAFHKTLQAIDTLFASARADLVKLELGWDKLTPVQRGKYLAVVIGELIGRFIKIHPFVNGNGRTSRIIWAVALVRFGHSPIYCITPRPKDKNYAATMEAAMRGNYQPLQLLILRCLSNQDPARLVV